MNINAQFAPTPDIATAVHKFGGSSLASADRFHAVADIVSQQPAVHWVVVSAPGTTTDSLLHIVALQDQPEKCQRELDRLLQQLLLLVQQSLAFDAAQKVSDVLQQWLAAVPGLLAQQRNNDILAIGERLSALLLSEILLQRQLNAVAIDARDFLTLQQHQVLWQQSAQQLYQLQHNECIHVVTGYIARDEKGNSITLGRNGSDYSATIVAALIKAATVTIWTDVDAIYSADPNKLNQAVPYLEVNWQQAYHLARLGNPVLHAKTLAPLNSSKTALIVRSSYAPEQQGCHVTKACSVKRGFITELAGVTRLSLHQSTAINAEQLATLLQQPVISLPHQAEGQQWLVPSDSAERALHILSASDVQAVRDTRSYTALAWLKGSGACSLDNVERLLQAWGAEHRYEDQEQVIWLLNKSPDAALLGQVHNQLIKAPRRLHVLVAGAGNVGKAFLDLFGSQQQRVADKIELSLSAVFNSAQAVLQPNIAVEHWQSQLETQGQPWQIDSLLHYITQLNGDKVMIDITPSQSFALLYPQFAQAGCHIISANKQGVTLPGRQYQHICNVLQQQKRRWLSNTTVGAGIPVQRVIQELRSAGDSIRQISGIFSGTLSWLLCKYDGSKPFSEFVLDAQQAGLTEPDPRDDLSGKDVQRKLLVLARELGLTLELDDISLQPLLPPGLEQGSWQYFWLQREQLDDHLAQAYSRATAANKLLRYVATLQVSHQSMQARVELRQVSATDPMAALAPCDNIFVIESQWYQQNPLVLKGPGAGPIVTAGGIHADLAALINSINTTDSPPV